MDKQQIIELKVNAMAGEGTAIGHHEGKAIFVSGAIPGETVRAHLVQEQKRWARACVENVLEPSPHRVEPPCPYFSTCGGCQFQHIAYEAQLEYKQQAVIEQLERLGHIQKPPVSLVIPMPDPWAWRNHAQFRVDEHGKLGFQAAHSHDLVVIDQCLLLHPLLDELHTAFDLDWPELERLSLRAGIRTGQRMCILETRDNQAPELQVDLPLSCVLRLKDETDIILIGRGQYEEIVRDRTFQVSSGSFFQVNTAQTEVMVGVIEQYLEPETRDTLVDVYCGVGTLGLSMQRRVGRLIGVEENLSAVVDAIANAGDEGQTTFVRGTAERVLPQLDEQVTKAILDPPRKGCRPQVLSAIAQLRPTRLIYVSCDPVALARDATLLVQHGYELVQVQPVDMFPQTHHIETVALWHNRMNR